MVMTLELEWAQPQANTNHKGKQKEWCQPLSKCGTSDSESEITRSWDKRQATELEKVFYRDVCACEFSCFSHVWLSDTSGTVACRAPLSTGFSRQEYWSGLPLPPPDLSSSEIKYTSPVSRALAGGFFTTEPPGKPIFRVLTPIGNTICEYFLPFSGLSFHYVDSFIYCTETFKVK